MISDTIMTQYAKNDPLPVDYGAFQRAGQLSRTVPANAQRCWYRICFASQKPPKLPIDSDQFRSKVCGICVSSSGCRRLAAPALPAVTDEVRGKPVGRDEGAAPQGAVAIRPLNWDCYCPASLVTGGTDPSFRQRCVVCGKVTEVDQARAEVVR